MSRRLPTFLRGDEPARLLDACRSDRDRLLLTLALYAELRVSEAVHLRIEDLNLDARE